jgi:hypothetical protein
LKCPRLAEIKVPGDIVDPYGLGYGLGTNGVSLISGGNFAFDGGSGAGDGNFTFDLTDIFKENNQDYWYLKIDNSSADSCIIKEFEITDTQTGMTVKDTGLPQAIIKEEVFRFLKLPANSIINPFVNVMDGKKELRVYLNPVSSDLIFYASQDLAGGSAKLFALNGELLLKRNILSTNKTVIPMINFPSGSYVVSLFNKNGSLRHNARIVKM